jgi:hypothetical protein
MREACRFATAGRIIAKTNPNGSIVYETNQGVVVPVAISDGTNAEASRNECIRYWFLTNCLFKIPLSSITISNAATLPGVPPVTTTNGSDVILMGGYSVTTNVVGTNITVSTNPVPATKGPGAANNYIQVTATMNVRTITPLMTYLGGFSQSGPAPTNGYFVYPVRVSAIVKNEPALLNFLHTNMYSTEP